MPRYLPRALRDKRGQSARRPDADEPRNGRTSDTPQARTGTTAKGSANGKAGAVRAGVRRPTDRTAPAQRAANREPDTPDIADERRRPSPRPRNGESTTSESRTESTASGATKTKVAKPPVKAPVKPGKKTGADRKGGTATRVRAGGKAGPRRGARSRAWQAAARTALLRRRLMITALLVGVLALVSGGTAGTAWYYQGQAQRLVDAREEAKATAIVAAKAVFSYDYRSFDQSVSNGKGFVTGPFAKEYAKTTGELKATAIKEKAIVWSDVAAVSVVSATLDLVEVLLYVNQYRKNANITGQKVDQNRITLSMARVGKDWKVANASAL